MVFVNFGIKDFGDLILKFPLNIDSQRWRLNTIRNFIRDSGFEHGDMENRMNATECVWKTEGERMRSGLSQNLKGTQELLRKFLGGTGSMEELGFNKGLLTNCEVRSRKASGVSGSLITDLSLGESCLKFLVEFVKVDHKVFGTGRSKVMFWVNGEVRMITFISKEQGDPSSSTRSVVVGKFCKWK